MALDQMTAAEHAVQKAAAHIPAEVCARFESADKLSDEDRNAIIEIARQALIAFQPKPEAKTAPKPEIASDGQTRIQGAPRQGRARRRIQAERCDGGQGSVMSDTTQSLRRKISSAGDLQSVVRTMKALAASSIGQYEKSVRALDDYYRTVELGLGACFRESEPKLALAKRKSANPCGCHKRNRLWVRPGSGGAV